MALIIPGSRQCVGTVVGPTRMDKWTGSGYPCGKPGKRCIDGRWYCGIHDPERRSRYWLKRSSPCR